MQQNACFSCRQRKLRCDKQQPCSNCIARSQECKQQVLPSVNRGMKRSLEEADSPVISSILSRLDRLEAHVNLARDNINNTPISTPISDELNALRNVAQFPICQVQTPNSIHSTPRGDDMRMANLPANDHSLDDALLYDLSISVSTDTDTHMDSQHGRGLYHIQLPPKQEALRLSHTYFRFAGAFQQIIYEPHYHDLINDVYHRILDTSETFEPRGLALILAVIASGSILAPVHGPLDTILPVLKQQLKTCAGYIRKTMDCLEYHRRKTNQTLENVQAMLVLSFLITHIETLSPRSRSLLTEAITVSHSLGLHHVDAVMTKRRRPLEETDPITQEMRRRVWWYLTSLDWLLSMVQGPSDAPYLISPASITTNVPNHINNDDLGSPNITRRPLSEPTTMSYVLHRLKSAEVARCIADVVPHDPNNATYEMIQSLDLKLENLVRELPSFFQLDMADSTETKSVERAHPYIAMQRLLLNLTANLVRCKLHYPYLVGHPNKLLHNFSRSASLKAARGVLSAHRGMLAPDISHSADFMKLQGCAFLAFMGALILAINLCCNNPSGEDRERQLSELDEVLERLDRIKQYSQSAKEFLEHLTGLLLKCKIRSPGSTASVTGVHCQSIAEVHGVDGYDGDQWDTIDPFPFEDLWEAFIERPSDVDFFQGL